MLMRVMVLIAATIFAGAAIAQKPQIFSDRVGAIRGYDSVAYFTQGAPVRGSEKFSHQWRGAIWYFASAEHRDRFAAEPDKFAPQYGGYCAYGVAQGYAPEIDPSAWSIVDGKLYLNFSQSIRERWRADIPGYIRKADANWPKVLQR